MVVAWEVLYTETASAWMAGLDVAAQRTIRAAITVLSQDGPSLGRPLVDTVKGSRHTNMKELRRGTIRVLFAFDPERRAVVLLGGDKRGDWTGWYERNIPAADDLYDAHLKDMR